jgi:hypothetical protein
MSLPWREKLAMLLPPSVFYRRRIAYETATGEPELAVLEQLMRRGGTAVDVGANQGFFAFARSRLATRVVCFEPNPDYRASFIRQDGPEDAEHRIVFRLTEDGMERRALS